MAGRYRSIEHTADLAIEVEADSVEELFQWAAHGMFDLIRGEGPEPAGPAPTRRIAAEGPDLESRLVAWLGELLYVHASEGLVLTEVATIELEDDRVSAGVALAPPTPGGVERELKGVTYHDLSVERHAGGWRARIVFDV
jgi:SHS2 domain-containing protein